MSLACAAPDPTQAIVERLADYLDCRTQVLGQTGFEGLAHGWLGPAVLGGCLTIYVGLIGFRLLLGRPFGPRDALLAALRVGLVIAFATSWPAYETVVYGLAIDGPAEIAAQALLPSGVTTLSLPEAARRLDHDYAVLQAPANVAAPSTQPAQPGAQGGQLQPPAEPQQQQPSPPTHAPDPVSTRAGLALTISTVGVLAGVRLAAGFLLALGPLIIAIALFDTALGVFEGWMRALVATFVAAVGTTIIAALELDFIESQLTEADQRLSDPTVLGGAALMATALLFGAAMIVVLIGATIIGRGFRIRTAWLTSSIGIAGAVAGERSETRSSSVEAPSEHVSRARGVADAMLRLGQRERTVAADAAPVFGQFAHSHGLVSRNAAGDRSAGDNAAGQFLRRRTTRPRTGSAERRDNLK